MSDLDEPLIEFKFDKHEQATLLSVIRWMRWSHQSEFSLVAENLESIEKKLKANEPEDQ